MILQSANTISFKIMQTDGERMKGKNAGERADLSEQLAVVQNDPLQHHENHFHSIQRS